MSYKYIDPGFGFSKIDGLITTPSFYPVVMSVAGEEYSRFGVAFYTESDRYSGIYFNGGASTTMEFFLKFDEYFPEYLSSSDVSAQTIIRNGDATILEITQTGNVVVLRALNDEELTATGGATYIQTGAVNTIWLHVEADEESGRITLAINGNYIFKDKEGWGFVGPALNGFNFLIDERLPVSNFIVSDEPINLNETIVEIGNSSVETTMIAQSDTYSSAGAGDYVLQTLDPSSLYSQFNSSTKVTAMVAVATPAYTTGDAVRTLSCRVVDGGNTTDYEFSTLAEMTKEEFESLEGVAPFIAKQLPVTSDTTFAELSGLKVGWVTGT